MFMDLLGFCFDGQIAERLVKMLGRRAARTLLLTRGDPAQVAGSSPTGTLALTHSDLGGRERDMG